MSQRRPHEPKGTYVSVIRQDHGWHDGQISGYLVDDDGTVEIDSEPGVRFRVHCSHRRDYQITTPARPATPSKAERRADRMRRSL